MSGEQSSLRPKSSTTYLYIENSYEPQARIDKTANNWHIYYYHTQLNGLPQALTDYGGHIVWKGRYSVWGKRQNETSELTQPQNLRFQGQYYDAETGLHYNTFRYYDPDSGHFTQQDPIGLTGGINQYAYAPNPLTWVDPLGLTNRIYEDAPYHGKVDNAVKSRAPTNGQVALDNSVQVKPTSPRRVGVDVINNEMVVMDKTRTLPNSDELFHGHVREWDALHPDQRKALKKAGMVDKNGNIKSGC